MKNGIAETCHIIHPHMFSSPDNVHTKQLTSAVTKLHAFSNIKWFKLAAESNNDKLIS